MALVSLAEIVARFGGTVHGDDSVRIGRITTLENAEPGDLTFLANPRYRGQAATTCASAVITAPSDEGYPIPAIVVSNPYLMFARVSQWLNPPPKVLPGIHPSAVAEGQVHDSASVGPHCYVAPGAVIGANVVLGPHCTVLQGSTIGAHSRLRARVTVYEGCHIGEHCLIHAGAVIGADGFGFARESDGSWVKIPQVGGVVIGNDVEIGACTTIDRGALNDTVIGDGVKLDNQIQIAHNVTIGDHSALAGCVGVAGSARIGRCCTVGGAAMILGHLDIADHVNVSSGTLIGKSIPQKGSYTGSVPFMAHEQWLKNFARIRHLDSLSDRIRELELRIGSLEKCDE